MSIIVLVTLMSTCISFNLHSNLSFHEDYDNKISSNYISKSNENMQDNKRNNLKRAEKINTSGVFFNQGIGIEVNKDKAFHLFYQAAQMGYAPAQYNLAQCYIFGDGVPQNFEKALPWLNKASEQGDVHSTELLEWLYLKLKENESCK